MAPIPRPIDAIPQFDAFVLDDVLYAQLVAQPSLPLYIGFDPKGGVALPLPPGTPVTQVPSPGFGLIMITKLSLPAGLIDDLVADGTLPAEEADALKAQLNAQQSIAPLFTGEQAATPSLGTAAFPGGSQEAPEEVAPEEEEEVVEPEEERELVRVGQFGSGFEEG